MTCIISRWERAIFSEIDVETVGEVKGDKEFRELQRWQQIWPCLFASSLFATDTGSSRFLESHCKFSQSLNDEPPLMNSQPYVKRNPPATLIK